MGFALYRFTHKYLPNYVKNIFDYRLENGINLYSYVLMVVSKLLPTNFNIDLNF